MLLVINTLQGILKMFPHFLRMSTDILTVQHVYLCVTLPLRVVSDLVFAQGVCIQRINNFKLNGKMKWFMVTSTRKQEFQNLLRNTYRHAAE